MTHDHDAIRDEITVCAVHERHEQSCQECSDEADALTKALEEIIAESHNRLKGLARQGAPDMPPTIVLEARLDTLIEAVLPDKKNRLKYELEVGNRVLKAIRNMQAQVKQPSLQVVKNMPSGPDTKGR